jgi:hypothetical protein
VFKAGQGKVTQTLSQRQNKNKRAMIQLKWESTETLVEYPLPGKNKLKENPNKLGK